jgi:8-oxo-dGTP pyrophosphatase MutT (NUDIX family)
MHKAKQFCAGIYVQRGTDGVWRVLGVTDDRFSNEVKFPGGTDTNAPWENPGQTFLREFPEETGFVPVTYTVIHINKKSPEHTQYFYWISEAKGQLEIGKEIERDESDGRHITVRWWEIEEFAQHLYRANHEPFKKVLVGLAMDPNFFRTYGRFLSLFGV